MTTDAQLIALLEWMGWKVRWSEANNAHIGTPPDYWDNPLKTLSKEWRIPHLTLDLMHEAVTRLNRDKHEHVTFAYKLADLTTHEEIGQVGYILALSEATKEQRLEALLKTIGVWKEEESAVPA